MVSSSLSLSHHCPFVFHAVCALASSQISMSRVCKPVIFGWIAKRLQDMLGFEDDVLTGMIQTGLDSTEHPDPRELQLQLGGFLEARAAEFVTELWSLLASAQANRQGKLCVLFAGKRGEKKDACLDCCNQRFSLRSPAPISA